MFYSPPLVKGGYSGETGGGGLKWEKKQFGDIIHKMDKEKAIIDVFLNGEPERVDLNLLDTLLKIDAAARTHEAAKHEGRSGISNMNCPQCAAIAIRAFELRK